MVMEGGKLDLAVDNKNRLPKTISIPIPAIVYIYIYINNRYSKEKKEIIWLKTL